MLAAARPPKCRRWTAIRPKCPRKVNHPALQKELRIRYSVATESLTPESRLIRQAVPRTLRCTFPVKVFHTTDERWQAKKVRCKRSDRESEPEEPDDPLKFLRAIRRLSCRNRKRAWPRPPDPVLEEWVPMDLDLQETRRCKVLDQIAFGENSHF